jgi:hypothetical protein
VGVWPGVGICGYRQIMADWNARQQRVAVLLASGSTIRNAAAETATGERTNADFRGLKPTYTETPVGVECQG